jgi:ribonuclease P protein component
LEFLQLYDRGWKAHGRLMTLFVLPGCSPSSRLGVAASRKVGGAVSRNRAKRRIRELFRRSVLPAGIDLVVVVRRELAEAPWPAVRAEFEALVARYGRARTHRHR